MTQLGWAGLLMKGCSIVAADLYLLLQKLHFILGGGRMGGKLGTCDAGGGGGVKKERVGEGVERGEEPGSTWTEREFPGWRD